jgi:hypothetical protein
VYFFKEMNDLARDPSSGGDDFRGPLWLEKKGDQISGVFSSKIASMNQPWEKLNDNFTANLWPISPAATVVTGSVDDNQVAFPQEILGLL